MTEVIVTDSSADSAAGEAESFAEGLLVGAAAATAAEAQETADEAQAEATVATVAAVDLVAQVAELKAVLVGLYDQMTAQDAQLAEAIALLLDEEMAMADEVEQAADEAMAAEMTAETAITEIVADDEPKSGHAGHEEHHAADDEAAAQTAADNADGQSGDGEPAGSAGGDEHPQRRRALGFRRGRR